MANLIINSEEILASLKIKLNEELQIAAEPIIQKALKDAEDVMRKKLASYFISYIDKNFSVERDGTDLRIVIHNGIGP